MQLAAVEGDSCMLMHGAPRELKHIWDWKTVHDDGALQWLGADHSVQFEKSSPQVSTAGHPGPIRIGVAFVAWLCCASSS